MNKKLFAGLVLTFISRLVMADALDQILKSAWADKSVKVAKEESAGLNSPGMSIIRQGQIFYAQDDKYKNNDYLNQKLGIRLYPFSLAEIKIQRKQASERKIAFADIQLSKALLDRYELIINYVETVKKIDLLTQVTEVAGKNFKSQVLASKIGMSDARRIVKARVSWTRMQRDLSDAKILRNQLGNQIMSFDRANLEELKDTRNWIAPADISKKIKTFSTDAVPLSAQIKQYEADDINAEQALSIGRRNSLIDYLEVSYGQTGVSDVKDTSVGFKISFNLPFFANDENSAIDNRNHMQKIISTEKSIIELKSQYRDSIQRLDELISTYSELSRFYNNSDLYRKSLSVDPQADIEALFESLSARVEFMELEKEIMIGYIKLVFDNGRMLASPNVNYLLADRNI